MFNISTRPTRLPEELGMYVDALRKRFPSLDEVWLLDMQADGEERRREDLELLAFGDAKALNAIRADRSVHRGDVNLMIVIDGDRFERAWGEPRAARLSDLDWRREDPQSATYSTSASQAARATAVRVR